MRVKVGNKWYDSEHEPICVELTAADRNNIQQMAENATKYASGPDDYWSNEEFLAWMSDDETTPSTSTCRDNERKAEALEKFANEFNANCDAQDVVIRELFEWVDEYRRQAEGGNHEYQEL